MVLDNPDKYICSNEQHKKKLQMPCGHLIDKDRIDNILNDKNNTIHSVCCTSCELSTLLHEIEVFYYKKNFMHIPKIGMEIDVKKDGTVRIKLDEYYDENQINLIKYTDILEKFKKLTNEYDALKMHYVILQHKNEFIEEMKDYKTQVETLKEDGTRMINKINKLKKENNDYYNKVQELYNENEQNKKIIKNQKSIISSEFKLQYDEQIKNLKLKIKKQSQKLNTQQHQKITELK